MWLMITGFAIAAFFLGINMTPVREMIRIASSELLMGSARASDVANKTATSPLNPNSCAPVTKEEIQLAFPVISDHLYSKERFSVALAAVWGVIPSQNEDPRIYDMFEAGLDNLANSAKENAEAKSDDGASSTILPLDMLSNYNTDDIAYTQIPQLNNMKLIDVIKGMVRGNLAPEQNRTIRTAIAQIKFFVDQGTSGRLEKVISKLRAPVAPPPAQTNGAPTPPSGPTIEGVQAVQKSVEAKVPDFGDQLEELLFKLGTEDLSTKLDEILKQFMSKNKVNLSAEDQAAYDQFIADLKAVTLPPCSMQTPPAEGKMCFCTDPNKKNCKWKPKAATSSTEVK